MALCVFLHTYLHCSINNRSETVTDCFIKATLKYGVPSRVRSDHGTENVGIWRFIEKVKGRVRHSYIAGRSVHNKGIERLWRSRCLHFCSKHICSSFQCNGTTGNS